MTKRFSLALLILCAIGTSCATAPQTTIPPLGEGPTPTPITSAPPTIAPVAPPAVCTSFARPGVLKRSVLNRTVDHGLGHWLGGVVVDPDVQQRRFRGWIIRSLYPDDPCYRQIDLLPGDVVIRVNGKSIERPEQADAVFNGLRTAPSLVVELIRDKAPRTVTLPIAEE